MTVKITKRKLKEETNALLEKIKELEIKVDKLDSAKKKEK